jgi:hypothetical protein
LTEFDDTLTRLFAETRKSLPADDFLAGVIFRMERERRRRTIKRAAAATAAAALAMVLTPYIIEGSLAVASRLVTGLPMVENALGSPTVWLGSLAIGAWGLRRAKGAS